jgi:hypothetical protein
MMIIHQRFLSAAEPMPSRLNMYRWSDPPSLKPPPVIVQIDIDFDGTIHSRCGSAFRLVPSSKTKLSELAAAGTTRSPCLRPNKLVQYEISPSAGHGVGPRDWV